MTQNDSKKIDDLIKEFKELKVLLLGNGKPGIFERIRNLETTRRKFFNIPNTIDSAFKFIISASAIWIIFKEFLKKKFVGG